MKTIQQTNNNLLQFCGNKRYCTIYADPPWRFQNRTGKVAPEHKRLSRYETMTLKGSCDCMDALRHMGDCGIVPVVVLDRVGDALETADALFAGGVSVMEITLRTKAGIDCIYEVAKNRPDVCVGAGTVVTLEQGRKAVDAGAKFIVSPGFDRELVEWCVRNDVAVTPGCVTPTEIMMALSLGVSVLKFFPANVYGGLPAMKALSGPFSDVKFIPTGGVGPENLHEYISAPFVHAVGGSWLCDRKDIQSKRFDKITSLSTQAARIVHAHRYSSEA